VDAQFHQAAALPDTELTWTYPCLYVDHIHKRVIVLSFVNQSCP
jgi:hypothetical protein